MGTTATSKLLLILACLAAAACRTSPPTHYYMLNAEVVPDAAPTADSDAVIGIGPLAFPQYLNRPQIVMRRAGTEVELLDLHRWAEPLDSNFVTVLADHVAMRTGSDRVLIFPWSAADRLDRRVKGEVTRFDIDEAGRAVLTVRWQVVDGEGAVLAPPRRSRYTQTATPGDHAALVAALAATVAAFSDEIVEALGCAQGCR